MSVLCQGEGTYKIPITLFKDNREKFLKALLDEKCELESQDSYILLQGGVEVDFNDTDVLVNSFRQESFFQYLFGVIEPGFYGLIRIRNGCTTLFAPRLDKEYEVWLGRIPTLDDIKAKYGVDDACYVDKMKNVIATKKPTILFTLEGKNSDSGNILKAANFRGVHEFTIDTETIHPILSECRVIKSKAEIEVLRYVAKISSEAHKKVMRMPFTDGKHYEYQAEALFLAHCYYVGGCRHHSYTCICGVGTNSAILHYGHASAPNNREIKDGDMCLFDMGANYFGFCADITCSFPANGKFTDDQKLIYNAVLAASVAVQETARQGVSWVDMHLLANRVMLEKLKEGQLLTGDIEEMIEAGLNYTFQPHGLGHLLGLDVHDVGGYLEKTPPKPTQPGPNRLRTARILKTGMYMTIEPGCYFIKPLLEQAYNDPKLSKFIVKENMDRFWDFGGVRIEDDVLITYDGIENFTEVPRTVEEIEKWMSGKTAHCMID